MSETNIGSADYGDLKGTGTDYSVPSMETDGPSDSKETEYINTNWSQQFGYYKEIPELRSAIDALARWTIGTGLTSNEITEMSLMRIKGFGKDTFNTILENQTRTAKISGDSFAEIIRAGWLKRAANYLTRSHGLMVNLKPLNPGKMKIVCNKKGIIIRYESIGQGEPKKFKPEQIFHLSRNRTADEIHGISLIDSVIKIILARNEAMEDMKQLMHRHVRPRIVFKLDTDIPSEIAAFKATADKASDQGENLFIPKGAVEHEILSVPANATLNPLPWISLLNQSFFQATGVPQIIVGGSQEMTEATAKIAFVAFETTIKEEQLYIEDQVLSQLNLEIKLVLPASLQNEMLSDQAKGETMQASTPEDTSVQGVPLTPQGGIS